MSSGSSRTLLLVVFIFSGVNSHTRVVFIYLFLGGACFSDTEPQYDLSHDLPCGRTGRLGFTSGHYQGLLVSP